MYVSPFCLGIDWNQSISFASDKAVHEMTPPLLYIAALAV